MPTWPATLPQTPMSGRWSWTPQRNKVSFQPELGPSIDRRRGSSSNRNYQAAFDLTSFAQVTAFEDWFRDDLKDGVLTFQWADPVDGVTYDWKFSSDDTPYQITAHRGTYSELICKLVRMT